MMIKTIPDTSNLVTNSTFNTRIGYVEFEIPDISRCFSKKCLFINQHLVDKMINKQILFLIENQKNNI